MKDSSVLDKAIKFAVDAHKDVERRGKGFPYVVHPLEAVSIVATMTNDQDLLAAAALHDVIEDTPYTAEELRVIFGDRITDLIVTESDIEVANLTEEQSWHIRKQAAIDRLKNASMDAKMVALGDKLSNMRAIYRDYEKMGEDIWNMFHVKEPEQHEWHYRGLAYALNELADTTAYKEFEYLINKVFNYTKKESK